MLGIATTFIPGFSSKNLSLLLVTGGLISSNYHLAVTVIAVEISASFFEFLSPMIFGIGNEATSLAVDSMNDNLTEESFNHGIKIVASGGLIGILVSLPLLFFAEKIYPVVYGSLKPIAGWMLLFLCIYMFWIEKGWKKKVFAVTIFSMAGLFGLLAKNSGLVPSEYLLLPIFIGLYGFSSIISKKHEKIDTIQDISWLDKVKATMIAFITTVFASMLPGMKSGQTSALALRISGTYRREQVLFMLPLTSLAFMTLSIFVLGSTGISRSALTYDLQEVMGKPYFSQTLLFAGSVAIAACLSACTLILLAKPIARLLSRINRKYLKIFGFCVGALLIINLTGVYGVMLAFTATCIGILSSRLGIKSTHMMGVLLLPSIITAIL